MKENPANESKDDDFSNEIAINTVWLNTIGKTKIPDHYFANIIKLANRHYMQLNVWSVDVETSIDRKQASILADEGIVVKDLKTILASLNPLDRLRYNCYHYAFEALRYELEKGDGAYAANLAKAMLYNSVHGIIVDAGADIEQHLTFPGLFIKDPKYDFICPKRQTNSDLRDIRVVYSKGNTDLSTYFLCGFLILLSSREYHESPTIQTRNNIIKLYDFFARKKKIDQLDESNKAIFTKINQQIALADMKQVFSAVDDGEGQILKKIKAEIDYRKSLEKSYIEEIESLSDPATLDELTRKQKVMQLNEIERKKSKASNKLIGYADSSYVEMFWAIEIFAEQCLQSTRMSSITPANSRTYMHPTLRTVDYKKNVEYNPQHRFAEEFEGPAKSIARSYRKYISNKFKDADLCHLIFSEIASMNKDQIAEIDRAIEGENDYYFIILPKKHFDINLDKFREVGIHPIQEVINDIGEESSISSEFTTNYCASLDSDEENSASKTKIKIKVNKEEVLTLKRNLETQALNEDYQKPRSLEVRLNHVLKHLKDKQKVADYSEEGFTR